MFDIVAGRAKVELSIRQKLSPVGDDPRYNTLRCITRLFGAIPAVQEFIVAVRLHLRAAFLA